MDTSDSMDSTETQLGRSVAPAKEEIAEIRQLYNKYAINRRYGVCKDVVSYLKGSVILVYDTTFNNIIAYTVASIYRIFIA